MRPFLWFSLLAFAVLIVLAARGRGRGFAIFFGIFLGIHTFCSVQLQPQLAAYGRVVEVALWYLQPITFLYLARFGRGDMKAVYRVFVSWPASWFIGASFLGLPWAVAYTLVLPLPYPWIPLLVASFGFLQSLYTRHERRGIVLDRADVGALKRHNLRFKAFKHRLADDQPLRIVQITDPHLGPFMSEARLKAICERAVREQPDLILLTGDFLTLESQRSPDPLARSLGPLAAMEGRVFACFGNHDHECPALVREALARARVQLLVDDASNVDLAWGPVQVIGADHRYREREAALGALARRFPREAGRLRLWLLHDPGAFQAIPEGEADLVFSGHTHGGHLGLLSLGLNHTIVSAATKMPDHGVWARGRDRLYVHRGTGHYGFPLRVGVPSEESVLEIYREGPAVG